MFDALQERLGYRFEKVELLKSALDRRLDSSDEYFDKMVPNCEHLEFVGDRVLNLCITDALSRLHPEWNPGQLQAAYIHYTRNTDDSKKHGGPLYRIAKELDLEALLTLKPGEALDKFGLRGKKINNKKTKEGLLSDHVEALLGAIFLDSGSDMHVLESIVNKLFEPLGLLREDHASVSGFGASAADSSTHAEEEINELVAINQRFIELISKGNQQELLDADLSVDEEVATAGFWVAITNKRVNLISYIVRRYNIESETIEEALQDEELIDDIKFFLIRYLAAMKSPSVAISPVKSPAKDRSEPEAASADSYFIMLAYQGNHQKLLEANLSVSQEAANKAFSFAVANGKANIVPYIVTRYGIGREAIEEALKTKGLRPAIKGYLDKVLKKLPIKPAGSSSVVGKANGGAGYAPPCPWLSSVSLLDNKKLVFASESLAP
jgi:dsRNA-specific ribonuclease